jgi:hypothetical protein
VGCTQDSAIWEVLLAAILEVLVVLVRPVSYHVLVSLTLDRHWFENIISDEILKKGWHLVLLNCYFSAPENQQFEYNAVKVAVLEERGKELSGYEYAYFPVYRIQEWLKEHCCKLKRSKHVMSMLPEKMYSYSL